MLGFKAVKDESLEKRILNFSKRQNFTILIFDGGFGKITDENIRFINKFYQDFGIILEPVYTGKMLRKIFELIEEDYFPEKIARF